jgi:hypothetical protein
MPLELRASWILFAVSVALLAVGSFASNECSKPMEATLRLERGQSADITAFRPFATPVNLHLSFKGAGGSARPELGDFRCSTGHVCLDFPDPGSPVVVSVQPSKPWPSIKIQSPLIFTIRPPTLDALPTGLRMRTLLYASLLAIPLAAIAQSSPQFTLREDFSTGGTIPRTLVKTQVIPLNKRYDELSPEQRDGLLSQYEHMGPGDEPPFPEDGLGPVVKAITKVQSKLLVRGPLVLIVDVGADGQGTSVRALGSPSPEMTQQAARVLLLTRYKPARCSGQPCSQQYRFSLDFDVN